MAELIGLITAILTPLTVVLVAWINNRKIEKVHTVANETLVKATATDEAVNGKQPGMATISQDVITIRDKQESDNPTISDSEPNSILPILRQMMTEIADIKKQLKGGL